MPIEMLWIFPILAVALFVFGQMLYLQRKKHKKLTGLELAVHNFNTGATVHRPARSVDEAEKRIADVEKAMTLLTTALANQQKVIEGETNERKISELKHTIDELRQEHDLIVSENYSLKARINKTARSSSTLSDTRSFTVIKEGRILEDTRSVRKTEFGDTSEFVRKDQSSWD